MARRSSSYNEFDHMYDDYPDSKESVEAEVVDSDSDPDLDFDNCNHTIFAIRSSALRHLASAGIDAVSIKEMTDFEISLMDVETWTQFVIVRAWNLMRSLAYADLNMISQLALSAINLSRRNYDSRSLAQLAQICSYVKKSKNEAWRNINNITKEKCKKTDAANEVCLSVASTVDREYEPVANSGTIFVSLDDHIESESKKRLGSREIKEGQNLNCEFDSAVSLIDNFMAALDPEVAQHVKDAIEFDIFNVKPSELFNYMKLEALTGYKHSQLRYYFKTTLDYAQSATNKNIKASVRPLPAKKLAAKAVEVEVVGEQLDLFTDYQDQIQGQAVALQAVSAIQALAAIPSTITISQAMPTHSILGSIRGQPRILGSSGNRTSGVFGGARSSPARRRDPTEQSGQWQQQDRRAAGGGG